MYVQYDDVTVGLIPGSAQAVLGYTDGRYDNRAAMTAAFPHALKTFLTVTGEDFSADGVDSEKGDASTEAVIAFAHEKIRQGKRPVIYTFLANAEALFSAVIASGIPRDQLILFVAHVTEQPHICGPHCGLGFSFNADATQWTFTALGRSLDESLCAPSYFDRSLVPPAPVDPHHYLRFGMERSNVMEYDLLRRHPIKNRKALTVKRYELRNGAERVAAHVIQKAKSSGKPRDWSVDYRGWRYQQLIERANGKRLVK